MAGFLGLGGKRLVGLCAAAGMLLAGCTQVVVGKGAVDIGALSSVESSKSSVSSAASSKASAVREAVCSALPIASIRITVAWNNFVDSWNSGNGVDKGRLDDLVGALQDTSARVGGLEADAGTDLGKAVGDYKGTVDDLLSAIKNRGAADELNGGYDKTVAAGRKLMGFCSN